MLVVMVVTALSAVVSLVATYRALRGRRAALLVPTSSFDPTAEEVRRFASVLGGTRRNLLARPTRRAHGVRLQVGLTPDRQVALTLEATPRAMAVIRHAVPHQVELQTEPEAST